MVRRESVARAAAVALSGVAALLPQAARAGPPFITDDPGPTAPGHLEVYLYADGDGRSAAYDGTGGLDFSFGLLPEVQVGLTLPLRLSATAPDAVQTGTVDLGVKYRFFNAEGSGWSAAFSPRITVPVAVADGPRTLSGDLPFWVGKVAGDWAVFGGGGYIFNQGEAGRDGWFGGVVVTRAISSGITLGVEANRRDPGSVDNHGETDFLAGAAVPIAGPLFLYLAAGPALIDRAPDRYTFYAALGATF